MNPTPPKNPIGKGLQHIEDHLGEAISLDDVARAAGASSYHFARTFRVLTGETVMGYVRRRRLMAAARRLADSDLRLIDLAFDSGFESQEAFTRAFKKYFHMSPGRWRKDGYRIDGHMMSPPDLTALFDRKDRITMEPKFVEAPERKVVGLMASFNEENRHEIPKLWEAFVPRMGEIASRIDGATFGVCFPTAVGDENFDYMAGVAVETFDNIPEGLSGRTIPAHRYAVFTHKMGEDTLHNDLQHSVQYIWGTWLPNSGFEHARVPDFEYYDDRMDPEAGTGEFDIYVPIK